MLVNQKIESLLHAQGFDDFKWLDAQEIVVGEWVRLKCEFGCGSYGRMASCPPNTPSVEACRQFFSEYHRAIVLHFQMVAPDPTERRILNSRANLKLLKLEGAIFMAGYHKAFLLFMAPCVICPECVPNRVDCKEPKLCRPTPEGMAVDVYTTVRKLGFPIEVLTDLSQPMNRYAFLMVD